MEGEIQAFAVNDIEELRRRISALAPAQTGLSLYGMPVYTSAFVPVGKILPLGMPELVKPRMFT